MINAEKIVFEKQNYYTPSWSGVTTVKILEVLPKGKVRVKAGESIFVRSIQYMFNTAKDANTSRRAWESFERKREYSCAVTPQVRQTGNRLSGLAGTAYASLLT